MLVHSSVFVQLGYDFHKIVMSFNSTQLMTVIIIFVIDMSDLLHIECKKNAKIYVNKLVENRKIIYSRAF